MEDLQMMRYPLCAFVWLTLSCSTYLCWSSARALSQQPKDIGLQVKTENGRTKFQTGELIPLKLSFTSSAAKKYQINMASYDRSGRMNYEKFLVEPESGWSDPLQAYFASGAFMMGGLTNFRFLSEEPTVISLDLNEWVRFDRPGKYRLRILSHRVGEVSGEESYAETAVELLSNELQLTIVPANKTWQEETFKKAVATLNGNGTPAANVNTAAGREQDVNTALKTLRYLGTEEATKELVRQMGKEDGHAEFECMFGLVGSPFHGVAISEMQRLLSDSDFPVSSSFVHALAILMRNQNEPLETVMAEDRKNREIIRSELLGAIAQKRGNAKALTLNTLLELGLSENEHIQPVSEQVLAQFVSIFDQLPTEKQMELLEYRWELIKGPAMLPILRKYAQTYREFTEPREVNAYNSLHLSGAALLHWYELEPSEARAVIIQEILRPKPRYTARVLGILPDKTLPEIEYKLAEHFVAEQHSYAAENLASLLNRYATDSVFSQVLQVIDKNVGKWACAIQAPALAYLLRVKPDVARPRIDAAVAARGDGYSACNHSLFLDIGALQQDPVLEEIAIHSLDDDDPEIAGNAAIFLGQYGSSAAEESLWQHLGQWTAKWRGKEKELRYIAGDENPNLWNRNLGESLIRALATGRSWLADEGKLQKLEQLSLDQKMQQEMSRMLSAWDTKPWAISYYRAGNQQHFQVLQYESNSLKQIEDKLAQFPAGSNFTWIGSEGAAPASDDDVRKKIAKHLAAHGMKLSGSSN
jgi:hypothetical protein